MFRKAAVPSDLIADVLEATFTGEAAEDQSTVQSSGYAIQQLIKALQQETSFDQTRLARIEWGLLPFLDKETSDARPTVALRTS